MLKKRIIPILLMGKNKMLVKGKKFNKERVIGSVIPSIKIFNMRQVDELILVDVDASITGKKIDINIIKEISKNVFFPFCIGGGINNCEMIKVILESGADKVCINTSAYHDQTFIKDAVKKFGSQCIVISIDVKKINNEYICFSHCGTINTEYTLQEWLEIINECDVGEVLVTSIDNDGIMEGYDKELALIVSDNCKTPFIISGGCASYKDMLWLFSSTKAAAAAASSIFQFTRQTPAEIKSQLRKNNINIRPIYKINEY